MTPNSSITRLTVKPLAETKKTQIQKTSRASPEKILQKLLSKGRHSREKKANRSSSTGFKNPGKGHTHEIKKRNKDI